MFVTSLGGIVKKVETKKYFKQILTLIRIYASHTVKIKPDIQN